jgi:site-specific DNA-methyltransferase (adenine-specific)
MMEYNKIYNESCLDTMQRLEDNSIDLVITSPPYDNMRKYGDGKNYHQRLKDTGYSFEFEEIAKELTRTLKEGGVIMWNVQDQTIKGSRTGNSMRQALYFMEECGLFMHDHLIWYKTGTPFPSPYRYRNVWENMFIFSKGKPNHFDPILKRNKTGGDSRKRRRERDLNGELVMQERQVKIKEWGIDDNVWYVSNHFKSNDKKRIENHPAIMPEELVRRHIQSWSIEGDIVYDPFSGSGTTSKVAAEMGRTYLGSEINKEYYEASIQILNESLKYKQFFE